MDKISLKQGKCSNTMDSLSTSTLILNLILSIIVFFWINIFRTRTSSFKFQAKAENIFSLLQISKKVSLKSYLSLFLIQEMDFILLTIFMFSEGYDDEYFSLIIQYTSVLLTIPSIYLLLKIKNKQSRFF